MLQVKEEHCSKCDCILDSRFARYRIKNVVYCVPCRLKYDSILFKRN